MVKLNPHGRILPTGVQIRAARAAVGLSVQELAAATGLGVNTVRRAEAVDDTVPLTMVNADRLVEVLEELGVKFLESTDDGSGIRYVRAPGSRA